MVLGAAQGLDALPLRGPARIDVLGDRRGADEADGRDVGMIENSVDRLLVAVHDVEHALRQTGFLQKFPDEEGRGRVPFRRLQDKGIPARDRDREHPHRHHDREVERSDPRHDAERLPVRPAVDVRSDVAAELALQKVRDPARKIDHVDTALQFSEGIGMRLAVLTRNRPCDIVRPALQEVLELEQNLGPLHRRHRTPGRSCRFRRCDGGCDFRAGRERQVGDRFSRCRIENLRDAGRRRRDLAAVDGILDREHVRASVRASSSGRLSGCRTGRRSETLR